MIDKSMIVGCAHFAVSGVLLKILGWILPCYVTCYYSCIANFLLFLYVARITFEFTKRWYLDERVQPENKAVFITGCDSGFGHLLAKRLDAIGYPVFASCYDENGSGAAELMRSCSKRMQIIQVDVTKEESVKNAVKFVKDNLGTAELWAIVNNAGIVKGFEVELSDIQDFKDTFEVNTFGPVRVTKAFLPLLRQSRGRIVNVTSIGGRINMAGLTPYIMSKYAAVAFTECLKQEMDVWGIRVISIEPELFTTGMSDPENLGKQIDASFSKLDPDVREDYGEKYLKNLRSFFQYITSGLASGKTEIVVDALDDAISLRCPDSVYKPCRNLLTRLLLYFAERIPICFVQAVTKIFRIVAGCVKPREAKNYL